jgi:hypothetical protein
MRRSNVGLDFETNRSWSITAERPGRPGPVHGLPSIGSLNVKTFGVISGTINGTAANFADIATAATQGSKNPHSPSSPIWMRPGQILYKPRPRLRDEVSRLRGRVF